MLRLPLLCLFLSLLTFGLAADAALRAQALNCAGPAFPAPLYAKWFQEYEARTGVHVTYQAVGSGIGSINSVAKPVDFYASDVPMSDAQLRAAPGILHLPMAGRAVVLVYSLPGLAANLRLSGPVIAGIYLGRITRWNDPEIVKLNPGAALPDLAVNTVHPSQGNSATFILTSYLSAVSPQWKASVGVGTQVDWPVGLGGSQGVGVSQMVQQNPGSLGYEDLTHALTDLLPCAAVQNARGKFIAPSLKSAAVAAAAVNLPKDLRGSIVNSPAGYPLVGYTYLLVYQHGTNPKVKDLAIWMLTQGQRDAAGMGYIPLPPRVQAQALAASAKIRD